MFRKCNVQKEKEILVLDIFKYKLCNVFSYHSMYMQQKAGPRFLNNLKTNDLRFTTLLTKEIAQSVEPLTGDDRVNAFVVDDSMFDHISMKCRKGYLLMTLAG